ncbi:MAG: PilZ domain-containing protein [Desulfosarcina sp.]|nr:PilZ domain-containing protein [Desulfosarcina sp.]MBC2741673.1 PilZ domain-containing protein [Desulfosarcina sp.]MBC2764587.1 PilZ domain-containing protein [Desulfosarcina sp.]
MVERRKYKRYPMPRGTFIILRNESDRLRNHAQMSIGEIAMVLYKSDPELMGQVTDMSVGGVAFDGHNTGVSDADNVELDLLMTEQGIYLHNIPYAAVSVGPVGRGKKKAPKLRTNVLCFKNLDAAQRGQLRELLTHHVG